MSIRDIAKQIMHSNELTRDSLEKYIDGKWTFKKDKSILDVKNAFDKSLQFDDKLYWLCQYLRDVFRKVNKV